MQDFDTEKAIDFVRTFLPGFLSLVLVQAVAELHLNDFEFIFFGIALSILIHYLTRCSSRSFRKICVKRMQEKPGSEWESTWSDWVFSLIYVVLAAFAIGKIFEHDAVAKGMNSLLGESFVKLSRDDTFYYVLKNWKKCSLDTVSPRYATYFGGMRRRATEPHKAWVVVSGEKSGTYEGHPRFFSSQSSREPSIYLAPACRVPEESTTSRRPIEGNGVLVLDVIKIEFLDAEVSECAKVHKWSARSCS